MEHLNELIVQRVWGPRRAPQASAEHAVDPASELSGDGVVPTESEAGHTSLPPEEGASGTVLARAKRLGGDFFDALGRAVSDGSNKPYF